jgi:hypothetical protein
MFWLLINYIWERMLWIIWKWRRIWMRHRIWKWRIWDNNPSFPITSITSFTINFCFTFTNRTDFCMSHYLITYFAHFNYFPYELLSGIHQSSFHFPFFSLRAGVAFTVSHGSASPCPFTYISIFYM